MDSGESPGRTIIVLDGDCRIIRWTHQSQTMFGWTEAEVLGCGFADVFLSGYIGSDPARTFAAAAQSGDAAVFVLQNKDAEDVSAEIAVSLVAFDSGIRYSLFIRTDHAALTSAKQLERERQFTAAVLDNAQVAIVACDEAGSLSLFNTAARRLHGLPEEPIAAEQWAAHYDLYTASGQPLPTEQIPLFRAFNGEYLSNAEIIVAPKGAPPRLQLTAGQPIFDRAGHKLGAVAVMQDVTELVHAREHFKRVIETANDAFVEMDAEGRITEWNNCAERVFGWTRTEVLGAPLSHTLIPPSFRAAHAAGFARFLTTRQSVVTNKVLELRALRRDGREIPIDLTIWPVETSSGIRFSSFIRDTSERKSAEQALRDANSRLDLALRGAQIGTWTLDLITDVLICDEHCPSLFGLPSGGLTTDSNYFIDLIHPDDQAHVRARLLKARGTGQYKAEYRVVFHDGSVHVLAASGEVTFDGTQPAKLAGVSWDVTARVDAENGLRASEAKLKEAQSLAHLGHWEFELESGKLSWSDETYSTFGLPPQSAIGYAEYLELIPESDREQVLACIRETVATGDPYTTTHRVLLADGSLKYVEGRGRVERDAQGKPVRILGTALDVTARVEADLNLRRSHEELEQRVQQRTELLRQSNQALLAEIEQHKLIQNLVSGQNEILRMIAAGVPTEEVFDTLLQFGERESGGQVIAAILLLTPDRKHLRWASAHSVPDEVKQRVPLVPVGPGNASSSQAVYFRKRVVISGIRDQTWPGAEQFARYAGTRTLASTPIFGKDDEVLGTVSFSLHAASLTDYQLRLQDACASLAAIALIRDQEQNELNEALRQYRFMADFMPQIIWTSRPDGWVDYFNEKWSSYTGLSLEQAQGWGWSPVIHPDDFPNCVQAWTHSLETGDPYEVEYRFKRHDGAYRWHLGRAVAFRNEANQVIKWFGTCTDIHEQKTANDRLEAEVEIRTAQLHRSLLEKETLLKEVHHRVKNNLQVISSLLKMQADSLRETEAAAALNESRQRVLSMALIHERLYGSNQMDEIDFGEYSQALVRELFYSYGSRSGNVISRLNAAAVLLNIDQAIPCGLILNELVTNALKYAYPDGRSGEIAVHLQYLPTGRVCLTVSDNGVGLPEALDWRNAKSLGLPIVGILAKQLGGTIAVGPGPGASFTLEFPGTTNPR